MLLVSLLYCLSDRFTLHAYYFFPDWLLVFVFRSHLCDVEIGAIITTFLIAFELLFLCVAKFVWDCRPLFGRSWFEFYWRSVIFLCFSCLLFKDWLVFLGFLAQLF